MDRQLRKLAAQKMLELHRENKEHIKRAHATRLVFKQAELGIGEYPQSYDELQEKVAHLLTQDLKVVEKALELTGGSVKLGELDSSGDPEAMDATETFQNAILNLI